MLNSVTVLLMHGICNIVLTLLNYFKFISHRNQRDWTVPTMYSFKLCNFRLTWCFRSLKQKLKCAPNFCCVIVSKVRRVVEEYYWVITQVATRSCCGWSGLRVLEFGFELDFLVYKVEHKNQMLWQHSCVWNIDMGTLSLSALSSVTQSISVTVEHWLPEHFVFAVETYFKTTVLLFWLNRYFVGTSTSIRRIVFLVALLNCCGWEKRICCKKKTSRKTACC